MSARDSSQGDGGEDASRRPLRGIAGTFALPRTWPLLFALFAFALGLALLGPATVEGADPPTIAGVSPATGPAVGGTTVTITGTNFLPNPVVTFGGIAATNVAVNGAGTQLTATTPAGSEGAAVVAVTNTDGQGATLSGAFTYLGAAPAVASVTPNAGPSAGGTAVTISGAHFASGASVRIGGTSATSVVFVNAGQLTATTPAHVVGTVEVQVTNPDGQSGTLANAFTYQAASAPTVLSVSPSSGATAGGTSVTISGTGFVSGAAVRFGSTLATNVVVSSSTRITAVAPARSAGAVSVQVTNPDGQSGTRANAFTYLAPSAPAVSSVSPSSGTTGGGTPVTITGSGFVSGATVRFGSTLATNVVVSSSTRITAVTPARAAGTVSVQVTNPDGQSGARSNAFTYQKTSSPAVSTVSPSSGPLGGGTSVTITGSNFLPGAKVAFGSKNATSVNVVNSSRIVAVAPSASAVGSVTVTVTNTDNSSGQKANAFAYLGEPAITGVSPDVGSVLGGTEITITGTNFASGATVTVGGTAATHVQVVSGTRITARTPAHAAGTVAVRVENSDGQRASRSNAFTYRVAPTLSSITPSSGPVAGGTLVTITGTGFSDDMDVEFAGKDATSVNVVNSTTLTAVTPPNGAGAAGVRVTDEDGLVASGSLVFTYTGTPQTGTITGGVIPSSGVGLFIFGGGSSAQLLAAAEAAGCASEDAIFYATNAGQFIVYVPGTSIPAVNATWNAAFADGIPANSPLMVRCA